MATFLQVITGWFDKDSDKMVNKLIDPGHVDCALNPDALTANKHYFRLRLAEMYLKKQVAGAKSWYPAVHSLVQFQFGGNVVEVPFVADSSRVGREVSTGADVTVRRLPLTPTMPFNGGDIILSTSLLAIEGENYLQNFIQVMGKFSGLLAVPQLSAALNIAGPLADGIQTLFGAGSSSRMHLGLVDAFKGGTVKEGYIASLRTTENNVDPAKLWVVEDQLRLGDTMASSKPYEDVDHMLLKVEVFENRDDWESLTSITGPYKAARSALKEALRAEPPDATRMAEATYQLTTAKENALNAPELTEAQRRIVVKALNEKFKQDKEDFAVSGAAAADVSLAALVRAGMTADEALAGPALTTADIYRS